MGKRLLPAAVLTALCCGCAGTVVRSPTLHDSLAAAARELVVPPPAGEGRLSAVATLVHGRAGRASLLVKASVEPGWHIYPSQQQLDAANLHLEGQMPTELAVVLPPGAGFAGEWIWPPARRYSGDPTLQILDGELLFVRELTIGGQVRAGAEIGVSLRAQACNDSLCLPVTAIALRAVI